MPDVSQGKLTPLTGQAAVMSRTKLGSVRTSFTISGVDQTTWFGPMQPLAPFAPPDVKGRAFDYQTGWNLAYNPRSAEAIGFAELRALADSCDVLRAVIEARKEQIAALDWTIRPKMVRAASPLREGVQVKRKDANPDGIEISPETEAKVAEATKLFKRPDKEHTWAQWIRILIEDSLVIDAACYWRRKTIGGQPYAFEPIDGATIFPLLDSTGRRPKNPGDPAYQQVLHGIPSSDYTLEELNYIVRNPRSNRVYGYSPVEQIVITVNTAIRRSLHQLEYYRSGSTPDAFVGLPETWNMQQVGEFQRYFDELMSGNSGMRRKARFMPGNFKYEEVKSMDLKDLYDEWLARIICFVLSVSPEPFITLVNRQSANTSRSRALEEGMLPFQLWIKGMVDDELELCGWGDLEFVFIDDREQDPDTLSKIDDRYVRNGIMSIDEIRLARGKRPFGGPFAEPMLATGSGYVKVGETVSGDPNDPNNKSEEEKTDHDSPDHNENSAVPNKPSKDDPDPNLT